MSNVGDGEEPFSRYGAALGTGAAKLGKKAAQSEVGRSAGRAAVTGAAEGVKEDLTNRYFAPGEATTPQPSPAPQSQRQPQPQSQPKTTQPQRQPQSQPKTTPNVAVSSGGSHIRQERAPQSHNYDSRPPKPSLFSRFKPHIGKKDSHQAAAVRKTSRDRVYKYNLSKEANWDEKMLVQALYNFKSERKCDLEFRKGQVIEVLTRTDNQHDWWEGKIDGRVGIFPANYVKQM